MSVDIRRVILARMGETQTTQYRLSVDQDAVHPGSAREFLRGNRDTTGRVLGELLDVAGLAIVPAELLGDNARQWLANVEGPTHDDDT